MDKKARVQNLLDFYKSVFLSLLTALFALLAYGFINFNELSFLRLLIINAVGLCLMLGIIFSLNQFFKNLDER